MKPSPQKDFFLDADHARAYSEKAKKSSTRKFDKLLYDLKKLDIKGRYLEIGCGPGILACMVADRHPGAQITATDLSPEMLRIAKNRLSEDCQARLRFGIADACDLNSMKEYGTFDLIYTTFTLHHWSNPEKGIRNLYSMLNTGGVLYIQDLKRVGWLSLPFSKNGFFLSVRSSFRPGEIKALLIKIGIENFRVQTIAPWFMLSVMIRKTKELDR